jgi:hypothetical protein
MQYIGTGYVTAVVFWFAMSCACQVRADDDPNVLESFVVAGNGDFLTLPVEIAGHEHRFIVDTGSSKNLFDATLEPTLRPTAERTPVNGKGKYVVFDGSSATVGRSRFSVSGKAVCIDLAPTRKGLGCSFDGALGMPFLRDKIVQINFDAGCLSFLKTSDGIHGETISLTGDGREPTIRVDLPDIRSVPFLIDTGNKTFCNGALRPSTLNQLLRARHATAVDTIVTRNVDAERSERVVVLDSLSVGGFRHEAQAFGEDSRNILGLGYLSRYIVTLDFPGRRMILARGKQYDRIFPRNVIGILVAPREGELIVTYAPDGCTGYSCGVRKGDTILEVNGETMSGKSAYDVMRILREQPEGTVLRISRKAANELLSIRLTGATPIAPNSRR